MDKILVLGGTFNPIHVGHLSILEEVRSKLKIDKGILIPNGNPPHKKTINKIDVFNMCIEAIKENNKLEIDTYELESEEKKYTIDTLKYLKEKYEKEIYFIVGSDFLATLGAWTDMDEIVKLCTLVIVNRPSIEGDFKSKVKDFEVKYNTKVKTMEVGYFDISSSQIRKKVKNRETIKYLVPESVREYIYKKNIYEVNYKDLIEYLKKELKINLTKRRYEHTLGVARLSKELAKIYGVNEDKAELAGMLHDYAKEFNQNEVKEYGKRYNLSEEKVKSIGLAHGYIGSKIAEDKYNIKDKEILLAIKNHTTGRKDMTTLEKIIYVADLGEENREEKYVKKIRRYMYTNLDKSLEEGVKYKVRYLKSKNLEVDKKTLELIKTFDKLNTK